MSHPAKPFTHFSHPFFPGKVFRITVRSHNGDPQFRVWGVAGEGTRNIHEINYPAADLNFFTV